MSELIPFPQNRGRRPSAEQLNRMVEHLDRAAAALRQAGHDLEGVAGREIRPVVGWNLEEAVAAVERARNGVLSRLPADPAGPRAAGPGQ